MQVGQFRLIDLDENRGSIITAKRHSMVLDRDNTWAARTHHPDGNALPETHLGKPGDQFVLPVDFADAPRFTGFQEFQGDHLLQSLDSWQRC
jgi:hypothetical protein